MGANCSASLMGNALPTLPLQVSLYPGSLIAEVVVNLGHSASSNDISAFKVCFPVLFSAGNCGQVPKKVPLPADLLPVTPLLGFTPLRTRPGQRPCLYEACMVALCCIYEMRRAQLPA